MTTPIRVVHYLNQFFGGIGGEPHANVPPQAREGPVGPGRVLQQALGADGTVVASIIAGDNYMAEERDSAMKVLEQAFRTYRPDVVVAGPAFEAGRYGLACAEVCREAQAQGIRAVTGMYPENAGLMAYRREVICVPTGANPAEMGTALRRMAALALKLGRGQDLGPAAEEGYLPRGIRKPVMREKTGAERAADMLKARLDNKPFVSEVYLREFEMVPPAPPMGDPRKATVALVTMAAITPRGNPDKMPRHFATTYYKYPLEGLNDLTPEAWESVHAGFNTGYLNTKEPSYAAPLPALRELEEQGVIKRVFPTLYSTAGVATAVADAKRFGAQMAQEMKQAGIDGALLVATWGNCNRCGATVCKEIERVGIPVALLTAIPLIPLTVGASRVVQGVRVEHVCGNPLLSHDDDRRLQMQIVQTALKALQASVEKPTLFQFGGVAQTTEATHA